MTKLSDDVRRAFDKEQLALGDLGDAQHRLIQNALASREVLASPVPRWAAGLAAVLIAAVVIATLVLVRSGIHSRTFPAATPSPNPVISPTPSPDTAVFPMPLTNEIAVPGAAPLILYHDPATFDQLDGMTWDGTVSGRVGVGVNLGGLGSPGGEWYTSTGDVRNRSGQVITTFDPKSGTLFWADDDSHYCDVARTASRDVSAPGMLQVGVLGQPPRNVVQIGLVGAANLNAGGPVVVACSPGADRAVVYQAGGQGLGVAQFWVVQLSTGHTLWMGGSGGWIVASHDGKQIALADSSSQTTIYGPSGAVLTRLATTVFGFSWDGTLAVTAQSFGASTSIVRWADGTVIWTCPGGNTYKYWETSAEPGGSHIAVGVLDPAYPQTGGFAPVRLFVVGGDGRVTLEMKDVILLSQ
jgi:hypothetical protein